MRVHRPAYHHFGITLNLTPPHKMNSTAQTQPATKPAHTPRIPAFALPIKLGMANGHNAAHLTDAEDNSIAQLYNIPLHCTVEDVRGDKHERSKLGLAVADDLIRAVNSHASLVEALAEALIVLEANKLDALGCENIRAALAKAQA